MNPIRPVHPTEVSSCLLLLLVSTMFQMQLTPPADKFNLRQHVTVIKAQTMQTPRLTGKQSTQTSFLSKTYKLSSNFPTLQNGQEWLYKGIFLFSFSLHFLRCGMLGDTVSKAWIQFGKTILHGIVPKIVP